MKINYKQTLAFKRLSGDTNKIHFNKKFTSKFFFKDPIVHGLNVVRILTSKFLISKNMRLKFLKVNFINFINIDESFDYKIFKNKILVFNSFNNKAEIFFKNEKNKNLRPNFNNLLLKELLFLSKLIGKINPGNGSLIQSIKIEYSKKKIKKKRVISKKITKQIYEITYLFNHFKAIIVANKLVPFEPVKEKTKLTQNILKKIKNKKILVFGPNSDLAKRIFLPKIQSTCKLHKYSFRINNEVQTISTPEQFKLKKLILNLKPDYIFYFSSPKILTSLKNSKSLNKLYKLVYVDYLKILLNIIKKNDIKSKIFYPSSIYLKGNNKINLRLKSYIKTKYLAEKLCKSKQNNKIVKLYRIPKIQSKSNYNLLGFYEGEKLSTIDKYINQFFKYT